MTQKRATPSIKRRRVGAQLRRWREEMGMPSGDAARAMGWRQDRFSRVERGYYRVTRDEVLDLCAKLGVDDPEGVAEVARVAGEPAGTGWWAAYAPKVSEAYLDFVELEAEAETIRIQHPKVVPGLVQSPGYVREMHSSARSNDPESLIAIRLARQEVLSRAKFHGLIPESALHAQFASGPGLMRDQIRKLLDASEMPNVTLQIVPLTAHPAYGSNGAMTILTFRNPWTPVASVDNPMGGSHTYDPEQVAYLEAEFDNIASAALPVDKSRDLLNEYLEGLHK
ncbi:helix-turn-helix transcriptional regulator [Streptomyces sp. ISL-100]|uniref:helix-turn-helix domain-containing protein n=1 Tax=Streptomyces sp. ISL-100 TaxID=2819173 RepID=UPI001BE66844|nr:helix-turn-helix transcriptional regulator [Streptomyces sp. ISL-100]MBT2396250.1 helix-turn-helix domain-containing protein [Streptomyces sp. ISL-100]